MFKVRWRNRTEIFLSKESAIDWSSSHSGARVFEINPTCDRQIWPIELKTPVENRESKIIETLSNNPDVTINELVELTGLTKGQLIKPVARMCSMRRILKKKVIKNGAHYYVYGPKIKKER